MNQGLGAGKSKIRQVIRFHEALHVAMRKSTGKTVIAPNYLAAQTEQNKNWPGPVSSRAQVPGLDERRSRNKRYEYKDRVLQPNYNPGIKECQFQMKIGWRERQVPKEFRGWDLGCVSR